MTKPVVLLNGAEADLFAAYERLQDFGKGEEFYHLINERLDLIQAFPSLGQPYLHSHRRILELKYSYGIYYRVYPTKIHVSAILPLKIHPSVLQYRLK